MSILKPVLGSQIQYGHHLAEGLIGYWLMNEGAGDIVQNISYREAACSLINKNGGSWSWQAGKFGNCLYLPNGGTGSTPVNNLAITNLTGLSNITLSIRMKPDSSYSVSSYIFDCRAGGGTGYAYWTVATGAITVSSGTVYVDSQLSNICSAGEYHHVVISNMAVSIPTALYVFCYNDLRDSQRIQGSISDILIYNRSFSASEVVELYINPFCMLERSPIELWTGAMGGGEPSVYDSIFMGCNF